MKNSVQFSYLIIFFLVLASCERYELDVEPISSVSDVNFWRNEGQVESFMLGIHSRLRSHSYTLFQLGTLRADEFGDEPFGGESFGGLERLFLNTLNEENPVVTGFGDFYSNINQINLLISKLGEIDFIDSESKGFILGQAYGLRAFYYFHLVRTWGDVVAQMDAIAAFDISKLDKASSSQSEILDLIISDIGHSESNFAENFDFNQDKKCFWSKAATLMLKAEVHLWNSKQMGGGAVDAEIARQALIEIQTNLPQLGLEDDFASVFSYDNKDNDEVIFTIRNELEEYILFGGGNFESMLPQVTYIGLFYDSLENRSIDKEKDLVQVRGRGMTTALKVSAYRKFNDRDSRKFQSIRGVYNQKDGEYSLAGCYLKKYLGTFDGGNRNFVDDFPIYRYADLLLLLAEAKAVLGEDPSLEINLVRARAFGDDFDNLSYGYPNMTGDSDGLDEVILRERFFEFIGEGKRWYDLRRFGSSYVLKYTTLTDESQLLWPIDLGTLTRNPLLTQTSGY